MGFTLLNAAYGTVATQSNSASTSVVLGSGQGAAFASASVANPVRCAVIDTATSPETLKFFLDVTGRSTDTLTVANRGVTDGNVSSGDANILVGYTIAAVATAGALAGSFSPVPALTTVATAGTSQAVTLPTHGTKAVKMTGSAASCALTFSGGTSGEECTAVIYLYQDGTGSRAWAFDGSVAWANGVVPTFATAASAYDVIAVSTIDGGTTFVGTLLASNVSAPTAPAQVTGLTAGNGNAQNTLNWTAPNNNGAVITAYKVYRSTTSGSETLLTTLGAVTTYTDTGLTNGTTYYYKVSAVNSVGEGSQSTEASATPSGTHYLNLPGTSGAYASSPSATANNITSATQDSGALEIRVKAALTSYTPATGQGLFSKWGSSTATQQYFFFVDSAGKLNIAWNDGAFKSATSTVALGLAANAVKWLRVILDTIGNGGTCSVKFYTSDDDITYTQLGTTVSGISGNAPHSTTTQIAAGADSTGASNVSTGKVYYAKLYKGVTSPTLVVDINFGNQTAGSTSFAGATGETWTVNGTASIV